MNDEILKKLIGIAKGDHMFSFEGNTDTSNALNATLPEDYVIYAGSGEELSLKPLDNVILAISKLEKGIKDNLNKIEDFDSFTDEDKQAIIDAVKQSYADEIEELNKSIEDIKKTLEESGSTPDSPSNPTETPIDRDAVSEIVSELLSEALKDFQPEFLEEHEEIASKALFALQKEIEDTAEVSAAALFELHEDAEDDDDVTAKALYDLYQKFKSLENKKEDTDNVEEFTGLTMDDVDSDIHAYSPKLARSGDVYRNLEVLEEKIQRFNSMFYIDFDDSEVEACMNKSAAFDGEGVSLIDAKALTSFKGLGLRGNTDIEYFDELQFFERVDFGDRDNIDNYDAFCGCTNLKSVVLPKTVDVLGYPIDYNSLPKSNSGIFGDCTSLESIDLSGVTTIGCQAFYNCTALSEITGLEDIKYIGGHAFFNTAFTGEMTFPKLKKIGSNYVGSDSYISVAKSTMPAGITKIVAPECIGISSAAFYASNLEEAYIPSIQTIGSNSNYNNIGAFMDCTKLKKITTGKDLKYIYNSAFQGCTSLEEIHLYDVIGIYAYAFSEDMINLENVYIRDKQHWLDIRFSHNLSNPIKAAYYGCPHLYEEDTEEILAETPTNWMYGYWWNLNTIEPTVSGSFADGKYIITLDTPIKISDYESITVKEGYKAQLFQITDGKITGVGGALTAGKYKIATLKKSNYWGWPYCVINLYHSSWDGIFNPSNKVSLNGKLESISDIITFEPRNINYVRELDCNGQTSIAANQFDTMYDLEKITGLSEVTTINSNAFSGLRNAHYPDLDFGKLKTIGQYAFNYGGTLPETVSLLSLTGNTLQGYAFCGVQGMKNVILPSNITSIGGHTFRESSLENINLENITYLEGYAFQNSKLSGEINLPLVTTIRDNTFAGTNITKLTAPLCTSTTANYAIGNCKSLTEVVMPKLTTLGNNTFNGCSSLSIFELPVLASIGQSAFASCQSLPDVYMPTVTEVKANAFNGCTNLHTISMTGLTELKEGYAFANIPNLRALFLPKLEIDYADSITNSDMKVLDLGKHVTELGKGNYSVLRPKNNTWILICRTATPPLRFNMVGNNAAHMIPAWVFVPSASVDAYKAAAGSNFADKIFAIGGTEWRTAFAEASDPYDEYADIAMYDSIHYNELVAAYNA